MSSIKNAKRRARVADTASLALIILFAMLVLFPLVDLPLLPDDQPGDRLAELSPQQMDFFQLWGGIAGLHILLVLF